MTDASSADRPTDARARLLSHFGSTASKDQGVKWDELWCEGSFLPWDKGSPNPALRDLLANSLPSHCVPSEATPLLPDPVDGETGRRRRALVPGCGKGYDVQLLAAAGYEAWGLEISPAAVEAAKQWSKEAESRGFKDGYETMSEKWGRGTANFVCGDFFKDDWLQQIGVKGPGVFDIIYDYTVRGFVQSRNLKPVIWLMNWAVSVCAATRPPPQMGTANVTAPVPRFSGRSRVCRISNLQASDYRRSSVWPAVQGVRAAPQPSRGGTEVSRRRTHFRGEAAERLFGIRPNERRRAYPCCALRTPKHPRDWKRYGHGQRLAASNKGGVRRSPGGVGLVHIAYAALGILGNFPERVIVLSQAEAVLVVCQP